MIDALALYGKTFDGYCTWDKLRHLGRVRGWVLPSTEDVSDDAPAPAWVERGVWVVSCPDCAGRPDEERHGVWLSGPHLMFCAVCGNRQLDGQWRRVVIPPNRSAIEALLVGRPPSNRNWLPGETTEQLIAENDAYGWEPTK